MERIVMQEASQGIQPDDTGAVHPWQAAYQQTIIDRTLKVALPLFGVLGPPVLLHTGGGSLTLSNKEERYVL